MGEGAVEEVLKDVDGCWKGDISEESIRGRDVCDGFMLCYAISTKVKPSRQQHLFGLPSTLMNDR